MCQEYGKPYAVQFQAARQLLSQVAKSNEFEQSPDHPGGWCQSWWVVGSAFALEAWMACFGTNIEE